MSGEKRNPPGIPNKGPFETTLLPALVTGVPGPESIALARRLAEVESQNATALDPLPIFWERAQGANLWDVDGNRFVDLTAAFGVANVGHAHPEVVSAISSQSEVLLHGMGDVHPPRVKVELLERLTHLYPAARGAGPTPARGLLTSSGSDAVETALKTAVLATGRSGLLAFDGAYHGLSLGALDATWRRDFRDPFAERLPARTRFIPYGDLEAVRAAARADADEAHGTQRIGALLVEPIQGRGGERVPPEGYLRGLREICDEQGWLLIADEIYTGFGRTGRLFACEHEDVVPDLLCIGKGLASGMPISACLGKQDVFDAWPPSKGEALHTQTFLGHPASCAAALASIEVSLREDLAGRSRRLGERALTRLQEQLRDCSAVVAVRGRGLMIGVECTSGEVSLPITEEMLRSGFVLLPSGDGGRVLSLTPPLSIGEAALDAAIDVLCDQLTQRRDDP